MIIRYYITQSEFQVIIPFSFTYPYYLAILFRPSQKSHTKHTNLPQSAQSSCTSNPRGQPHDSPRQNEISNSNYTSALILNGCPLRGSGSRRRITKAFTEQRAHRAISDVLAERLARRENSSCRAAGTSTLGQRSICICHRGSERGIREKSTCIRIPRIYRVEGVKRTCHEYCLPALPILCIISKRSRARAACFAR